MTDWLARYCNGHEAEVWRELATLDLTDADPDHIAAARLVCDEMARRARSNVETVVSRLTSQGYRFHANDHEQEAVVPHVPPGADTEPVLDWLGTTFGPVPLTLSAWMRGVGDVWLVGTHPRWTSAADADPLVIQAEGSHYTDDSILDYYEDEVEAWTFDTAEGDNTAPFVMPLAPDRLHKANVSGGAPYGLVLPSPVVDATFVGAVSEPFVDYLNGVFGLGGFPGVSDPGGRNVCRSLSTGLSRL